MYLGAGMGVSECDFEALGVIGLGVSHSLSACGVWLLWEGSIACLPVCHSLPVCTSVLL